MTRPAQQMLIESLIDKGNWDYLESSEILAAIVGQLRRKYDNLLSPDLEFAFSEVFDLLDEAYRVEQEEELPDIMEQAKQAQVNDDER